VIKQYPEVVQEMEALLKTYREQMASDTKKKKNKQK
jgi:hypothetical protein